LPPFFFLLFFFLDLEAEVTWGICGVVAAFGVLVEGEGAAGSSTSKIFEKKATKSEQFYNVRIQPQTYPLPCFAFETLRRHSGR
jgi:hypothetical protein